LRPNIVFVFADDWGRYASAYRQFESDRSINQLIETPNFDRIAREGAIFKNALVPAPTCTPCRSSLLTGRLPAFLPDVPEIREDVNDYLGGCMAFDAGLGVLLERLEASGELNNRMIVVSGDHGIPGIPRAKCNLYDIGTQVALAVRWPGHVQPGRVIDDFVNLMLTCPK
jgi:arylsulfatase A-like enzyme